MVIKLFYTLIVIFGAAMVFVVAQDPYMQDDEIKDFGVSSVQILNATTYELSKIGVVGIYKSSEIKRFEDHDEFKDFKAQAKINNVVHTLSSKTAIKKGDELKFIGDVDYKNSDDIKLVSELAIYDISKKEGLVPGEFSLWQAKSAKAEGKQLSYLPSGEIRAQEVKAWLNR